MAATTPEQIIEEAQRYADQMKLNADSSAEKLAAYVDELDQLLPDYETNFGFSANRVEVGAGEIPTLTATPFSWDANFFNPSAVTLPQLDSDYFRYLQTVIERELMSGDAKSNELISKLFELINSNSAWLSDTTRTAINNAVQTLVPKLANDIQAGGTGISASVQTAIFDAMYERDRQALRDALIDATDNVARRGFPLPTSMSQAARDAVLARNHDTLAQRSRDITVLIAERAQQNVQFATNALIQLAGLDQQNFMGLINGFVSLSDGSWKRITESIRSGADLEKLKVDYSLGYARVFNEVNSSILSKFKAEQDAKLADFDAQFKNWSARFDVRRLNAEIDMKEIDREAKLWELEFLELARRTEKTLAALQQDTQVRIAASVNLMDFYKGMTAAALGQTNAITTQTQSIAEAK